MRRFRIKTAAVGEPVSLPKEEGQHAVRVLRLKAGEEVALFDGNGKEWLGRVEDTGHPVRIQVLEEQSGLQGFDLTVACACPKGKRLEFLVQKLAELGAHRFVPVAFERSVVRLTPPKQERLQRVSTEASKQCGRADMMEIAGEVALKSLPGLFGNAAVFLAQPGSNDTLLQAAKLPGLVVIGPEGGLTAEEVALLLEAKAKPVTLSSTILRTETAALAAAAVFAQTDLS